MTDWTDLFVWACALFAAACLGIVLDCVVIGIVR